MSSRWCRLGLGWVDPSGWTQGEDLRVGVGNESFGVSGSGIRQDLAAGCGLGVGEAVVDVGRGVQADAAVVVFVVVPLDEDVQEASSIDEAADPFGEGRPSGS